MNETEDRYDKREIKGQTVLVISTVARKYGGIEQTSEHGAIPSASTYVVDEDRTVRYTRVVENPSDRTYANYVRAVIRDGVEIPFSDE